MPTSRLPDATPRVRAAAYIRQSSRRENASEASPAVQRIATREKSDELGAAFVGSYEDIGISAYSGQKRPAFERLIADCRAGGIDAIIVHHVSRFSRMDPIEAVPLVIELLDADVAIVSVVEGEFRKGNAMGLIHLIMRLDQAYNESWVKSVAIRGAHDVARSLGGFIGGKAPYGFRIVSESRVNPTDGRPVAINLLAPDPAEARVIRQAADELLHPSPVERPPKHAGQRERPGTLGFICRRLNANGTPTRGATTGKLTADSSWSPRTLERIMRDPRVAGYSAEVIYKFGDDGRKTRSIQGYRILCDSETGVRTETHPAVLEPGAFWAVQRVLDDQPSLVHSTPTPSLLASRGMLRCECGSPMKSNSNSAVAARSSYRCSRPTGRRLPGQHASDCTISKNTLDAYIARRVFTLISTAAAGHDSRSLDVLLEAGRLFALEEAPESAGLRARLQVDVANAERQLAALSGDRVEGRHGAAMTSRDIRHRKLTLSARIDATVQRLAAIRVDVPPAPPIDVWLGEPGADPLGPGSWWDCAPMSERRAMLALFIRRITVSKSPSGHTRPPVEARVKIAWVTGDL